MEFLESRMSRSSSTNRERFSVMISVIAIHLGVLFLIMLHRTTVATDEPKPTAITAFAVATQPAPAAKAPPPVMPSRRAIKAKPPAALSTEMSAVSTETAETPTSCSTLAGVLNALLIDPVAVEQVRNSPPATRSIAGAIVIWNLEWAAAAASLDTPLGGVRTRIEQVLGSSPGPCLDEDVAGPRLFPIPDGHDGTIFLVIGSGNWRWRALLASPLIQTPAPTVSLPDSSQQ
jgi:hypothetical protein